MRVYPTAASVAAAALLSLISVSGQQVYDVVVVGSGPGGLVAAEYLSRDPTVSVLILEAGLPSLQATGGTDVPDYAKAKGWTQYDVPGEYDNSIYKPANEKYRVDWINGAYVWLGKLVGGCSSINAQLYFRTPDAYVTNMKWPFSPDRVSALMDENEQTIHVTDKPSPDGNWYLQEGYNIVASALRLDGYSERTINDRDARNNKSKTFGHAPFSVKDGLRDAPAKSFWNKMKTRPNVKLVTSAMVNYIKQYEGQASAVVYNSNVEVKLSGRGAVVMAAGALSTPKVLIQSAIGPRDQINLLTARSDFPGVKQSWILNENVGKNLFDTNTVFASFSHPGMKSFQYKTYPSWAIDQYMTKGQTGPWASFGPTMIGYENYAVNGRPYEFQTTVLTNGFTDYYSVPDALTIAIYVNNPESRDRSFFTADGKWTGFTGSLYFSTQNDLTAMQSYTSKIVDLMRAKGATFISAKPGQSTGDWVNEHRGWITHHFGGSCYVSADAGDSRRCADDKMRVVGTKNVFVADASAMRDGTVNPYAFIMYMGREAGSQVQAHMAGGAVPPLSPLPTPPTTPTRPAESCGIEENVDYAGNDVGDRWSASAEGCCDICKQFSGCNAFTWTSYNGGTCWLKSAKGPATSSPGVRSAVINAVVVPPSIPDPVTQAPPTASPSMCSALDRDTDYSGSDVGSAPSATPEGCCKICSAKSGCGAYTWTSYEGGTCWLKAFRGAKKTTVGAHSALVSSAPQCNLVNDTDYTGAGLDIGDQFSKTSDGCCDICRKKTGCKAFTWTSYNGGTCWLKSAAGATKATAGAASGTI